MQIFIINPAKFSVFPKFLFKNSYSLSIFLHNSLLLYIGSSLETIVANLECSDNIFITSNKFSLLLLFNEFNLCWIFKNSSIVKVSFEYIYNWE